MRVNIRWSVVTSMYFQSSCFGNQILIFQWQLDGYLQYIALFCISVLQVRFLLYSLYMSITNIAFCGGGMYANIQTATVSLSPPQFQIHGIIKQVVKRVNMQIRMKDKGGKSQRLGHGNSRPY